MVVGRLRSGPIVRLVAAALLCSGLCLSGCAAPKVASRAPVDAARQPFAVTRIEVPYRACDKPQRVGSAIYMVVSEEAAAGSSLVRYNPEVKTGETVVKTRAGESIGWFVVNEKWLVWSVDESLFARELAGGQTRTVAKGRDLFAPALGGDLVALDELTPRRTHQMTLHDLARQESTVVAPIALADLYNNFPDWDGERLVWSDVVAGDGLYRVYDSTTGRITDARLSAGDHRIPGYAQASAEKIYSINFDDASEWNWGDQRFGYYSAGEGRFVPLVPEGTVTNSFEVAGGLVAIVDSAQRLSVRLAETPETVVYRPVKGHVDFVQSSSDGTIIAWREGATPADAAVLYLLERR